MDSEYGNDLIVLTGENGEEVELEHLDSLELNGETYAAFIDAHLPEEEEEAELYILKFQEQDGEEILVTVDDEQELEQVYNLFLDRFAQEDGPLS